MTFSWKQNDMLDYPFVDRVYTSKFRWLAKLHLKVLYLIHRRDA